MESTHSPTLSSIDAIRVVPAEMVTPQPLSQEFAMSPSPTERAFADLVRRTTH